MLEIRQLLPPVQPLTISNLAAMEVEKSASQFDPLPPPSMSKRVKNPVPKIIYQQQTLDIQPYSKAAVKQLKWK